jgi:hypothetical protein
VPWLAPDLLELADVLRERVPFTGLTACAERLRMDRRERLFVGQVNDAPDSPESRLVGGPIQDNPGKSEVRRGQSDHPCHRERVPLFCVHGTLDRLLPFQSQLLLIALQDAGASMKIHPAKDGRQTGII